jgi:hypothetical protein
VQLGFLQTFRVEEQEPVAVEPLVIPRANIDGWTLEGTALAHVIKPADRRELATLLHCLNLGLPTPWAYERTAQVLEANGQIRQALAACEAWFALPERVRQQRSTQTRRLDRYRQRLRAMLHTQQGRRNEGEARAGAVPSHAAYPRSAFPRP